MADAGSNLGKLTPKYDFSQYRYREIASRSLTKLIFPVSVIQKEQLSGVFISDFEKSAFLRHPNVRLMIACKSIIDLKTS